MTPQEAYMARMLMASNAQLPRVPNSPTPTQPSQFPLAPTWPGETGYPSLPIKPTGQRLGGLRPPMQMAGDVVKFPVSPQVEMARRLGSFNRENYLRNKYGADVYNKWLETLPSAQILRGPGSND